VTKDHSALAAHEKKKCHAATRTTAGRTLRACQRLLRGEINSEGLMAEVEALEKLGVTEGTLVEK